MNTVATYSSRETCLHTDPVMSSKRLAKCQLAFYSGYFGLNHGINVTDLSQIGLPCLLNAWMTLQEQLRDILCCSSVVLFMLQSGASVITPLGGILSVHETPEQQH